jgi:dephospho-CoA kinase
MLTPTPPPHGPRRCPLIGVLGGIASGKSAVARLLAGAEGRWLSADALAHAALLEPEVAAEVRRRFGAEVFGADGQPDRAALARRVFADAEGRRALEALIHPRVRAALAAGIDAARAAGAPLVCLDVPLLLENDAEHGLARACDLLLFVDAPLEQRERRATQTRGWAPGEVLRREAAQWPLENKRALADLVLWNHGEFRDLERRSARLRALLVGG